MNAQSAKAPFHTRLIEFSSGPYGAAAGSFLLVLAALVSFLSFHNYQLASPEVALMIIAIAIFSVLFGAVYAVGGLIVRSLLIILLLLFGLELLHFHDYAKYAFIFSVFLLREKVMFFVMMISASILIIPSPGSSGHIGTAQPAGLTAADNSSGLPAVLHLILDEHIEVDGLGVVDRQGAVRQDVVNLYDKWDFTVFEKAFSRYNYSNPSISSMLNFAPRTQDAFFRNNPGDEKNVHLTSNRYFDELKRQGYRLNVTQFAHPNYCSHPAVASCTSYSGANPGALQQADMPASDKAKLLAVNFLRLSGSVQFLSDLYHLVLVKLQERGIELPQPGFGLRNVSGPVMSALAGNLEMDKLSETLSNMKRGEAYFIHIALPHYPYVYASDCRVKPLGQWRFGAWRDPDVEAKNRGFLDQLACTVKKVDTLLTRLTAANVLEDTVVIIHGDHGSRNSHVTPAIATLGGFSDKEMIEHHSTLFAVRNPRYDRANYPGYIALDTILRELTMNDFNPAHVGQTGDDPWIVLRSKGELGDADKRYPYPDGPGQDATQQ